LREFLFPQRQYRGNDNVSASGVRSKLRERIDEPVRAGDRTLILKTVSDTHARSARYFVAGA
jgi:hypothetical protein